MYIAAGDRDCAGRAALPKPGDGNAVSGIGFRCAIAGIHRGVGSAAAYLQVGAIVAAAARCAIPRSLRRARPWRLSLRQAAPSAVNGASMTVPRTTDRTPVTAAQRIVKA